jgi:GTP-binding protein
VLPTVVLVGRPNVGKSTLFNRLTRSRAALVADFPGLTRDRHYGRGRVGPVPYLVVDTGGFEPVASEGVMHAMARQTRLAIDEADVVLFLVDARSGLTPQDREIGELLRRSGRPVVLVVNKAEGMADERSVAEFHELGLGDPVPISAAHGDRVAELMDAALAPFTIPGEAPASEASAPEAPAPEAPATEASASEAGPRRIRVAVIGRPNVGKSTLVNAILGEERVVAFDEPGTTRDSIYLDFDRGSDRFTLIDTAGIRRRGKVTEAIEKFSVIKTMQAIEDANVVVLLLDAQQDIADQDAHIAGYILEAGRALVVAVNKWDGLPVDRRDAVKRDVGRKLAFLGFARHHFLSARKGTGIAGLLTSVKAAYAAAMSKLPTPKLTRALQQAVQRQAPPRSGLVRPKLRYAHQGGMNPPLIVIHGTALDSVPDSYRRYLERFFAEAFQLQGTPVRIQFRTGRNPYVDSASRR